MSWITVSLAIAVRSGSLKKQQQKNIYIILYYIF